MEASLLLLAAGLLLANASVWVALGAGPGWLRVGMPVLSLSAWLLAPTLLDTSFKAAAQPGHALAVGAGLFALMGFPAWIARRLA